MGGDANIRNLTFKAVVVDVGSAQKPKMSNIKSSLV
jgi:hypothetical protein